MNFFRKRNNLDELINIPIKAEERFVIQISFRTQGPNKRQAQSGIRFKNYSRSTIRCVFKIGESARFTAQIHNPCAFKAKSVDPKTYSPPSKATNGFLSTTEEIIFVLFKDTSCLVRNLKHRCSPRSALRTASSTSFEFRNNNLTSQHDATTTSFQGSDIT